MTSNHMHDHGGDVNHVGADAMTGIRDWNTESIRWRGVTTNVPKPVWVRGQGIK